MSTHNYRIDGKIAPKGYAVRIEQLKTAYKKKNKRNESLF